MSEIRVTQKHLLVSWPHKTKLYDEMTKTDWLEVEKTMLMGTKISKPPKGDKK